MNRKSRFIRCIVLLLAIFPMLGCFSMTYFVDMDADASGKGTIYYEAVFPDIGDKGAASFDKLIQQMVSEGWENFEFSSPGNDQIKLTADYRLDVEAGREFPAPLKGFTITVGESEIGYRLFTFSGSYNFTQLQTSWDNLKNSDAPDLAKDLGEYLEDTEITITSEEIKEALERYGDPSFTYKVRLPGNTPVEAKGLWTNREEYEKGQTDTIEFTWKPGQKTTGTLVVSRRMESKPAAVPGQTANTLQQLTDAYMEQVPAGWQMSFLGIPSTPGLMNNIIVANLWKENFTCGAYQNRVMDFLDGVRTSPDKNVRSMLAGYEYGPIQTSGGGHVAVVVFPTGTDWTKTGTVLDPWPTQKPAAYDIQSWFLALGPYMYSAYSPEPAYSTGNAYPQLTGKPASYPALDDIDRPTTKPIKQILVINSPVTVMLKLKDGREAGIMPGKNGINQAQPDVSFYALDKDEGGKSWLFFLPDDAIDVTVYGQNEGTVHVALVTEDGISGYGAQPIHEMESATFSIGQGSKPGTLTFESGAVVKPAPIKKDQFAAAMGVTESAAAPESVAPLPTTAADLPFESDRVELDDNSTTLTLLVLGCCCCLLVIVIVVVVVVIVSRRKKSPPG